MGIVLILVLCAGLALAVYLIKRRNTGLEREHFIRTAVFPAAVMQQLSKEYPHLDMKDAFLVARAMRQFFLVFARAKGKKVHMPSLAVDVLWHAFILDTRAYSAFCKQAFGQYLHHVPSAAMPEGDEYQIIVWRTWKLSCLEENIKPDKATRLPLLYALDMKLNIPGATKYDPAAFKAPQNVSTSGSSCVGDSSGCGGGCGGD